MVLDFTICFMSYSSKHAWQYNFSISAAADVNVSAWEVSSPESTKSSEASRW